MIAHLKAFQEKHLFTNKAFKRCLLFLYICTIFVPETNWAHGIALGSSFLSLNCNRSSNWNASNISFCWNQIVLSLKQSTALQSFPLTSTTVENQGTWGKERDTICDARDHKLELSSNVNNQLWVEQCGWKRWQLLVAIAIIAQLPPASEPCRTVTVLCCVHHTLERQTSVNEIWKVSEFVAWVGPNSKVVTSPPLFGQCRYPRPPPIWKCV